MDGRLQNMEQQLSKVNDLQETVLGFREEIQMMGRSFRQELQTMAQEIRDIANGAPHRNRHQRNNENTDNRHWTQLSRMEFPRYEKPMAELTHLRQAGTLAEFNVKFDTISAKLDLPEAYLVEVYVRALKEEIADFVLMFDPQTLAEARCLARVQEIAMNHHARKKTNEGVRNLMAGPTVSSVGGPSRNSNAPLLIKDSALGSKKLTRFAWPLNILSAEEEADHRTKNLNFYYREKFTRDHWCQQRQRIQLHFLALEEDVIEREDSEVLDENYEESIPLISLYATQLAERDRELMWLQKSEFEKSNPQLASIFSLLQQCFGGYVGICNAQWAYGLGCGDKEECPMLLQLSLTAPLGAINYGLFQKWASFLNFTPTRIMVLEWFKGELIAMLFGRVYCLSKKQKEEVKCAVRQGEVVFKESAPGFKTQRFIH